MKKTAFLVIALCCMLTKAFVQTRGGNPKFDSNANPYIKILQDTAVGKRTAKFLMNFVQPEVLRDYFTSSPCSEYTQLSDTRITQFTEFVAQFMSGRTDVKQMTKAENDFKKKGVSSQAADIDYHINFIEQQGTFITDATAPVENLICRARGSLQAIKSIVSYLEAIRKVFPSVEAVDEVIQKAKQILLSYPDNKSLVALIKKNRNQ